MEKRYGLNRTQLKIIAIISMVKDHFAWGFVDFYSPLGQILHVMGRFTVPIMCFFIAEGFRKTSNLKAYIYRMVTFAIVSVIPFYIFFHEEYGYRQNIIFDLLLGLLMLTVLENKRLKKPLKVILTVLLFVVSVTVGGWIVTPSLFILAFYYGRTFREKAIWFCIADLATVAFLVVSIILNNHYHFMRYEWVWWDKLYLLGFMLALPLLYLYNGEKGKNVFGMRYFFYLFYPCHFLILSFFRSMYDGSASLYDYYLGMHVLALVVIIGIFFRSAARVASKGQSAVLIFELSGMIYVVGFIMEILSNTPEGVFFACVVQYFGEMVIFITATYFASILCNYKLPTFVYLGQAVFSLIVMYVLIHTRETGLFYTHIGVDISGPFTRPDLGHGVMFYGVVAYVVLFSAGITAMCIYRYRRTTDYGRRRIMFLFYSLLLCWFPYMITLSGITGGYEVPAIGIAGAAICMYLCLMKYGFFDSVALAGSNALNHGREGILVFDIDYHVGYSNKKMQKILGVIPENEDVRNHPILHDILNGEKSMMEIDNKTYDFVVEPLMEGKDVLGHMLWAIDNTVHYESLAQIRQLALRDPLTGLYNRNQFQRLVNNELSGKADGTFFMVDFDNFKDVNDNYGHQTGDNVLMAFAKILSDYTDSVMYASRIGGDEFCGYIRGVSDEKTLEGMFGDIIEAFASKLESMNLKDLTSLSIGALRVPGWEEKEFQKIYAAADKILYKVKNAGKNNYMIH